MNNTITNILLGVLIVLVAYSVFFKASQVFGAASTTGATNTDAKIASIAMAPISNSATSTSILNTDSSDRIITDAGVSCTGLTNMFGQTSAGLATYNWTAATSSTAAPTASIASAQFAAMQVTVATTTPDGFTATSTYTSPYARRWNAGTYLIFQTNGTSSAASCTPFVRYIAS